MKKDRKREIKNYKLYNFEDEEYYGIFKNNKTHRIKIDVKRFIKETNASDDFKEQINAIPRNTIYFIPKYPFKSGFACNSFKSKFEHLSRLWFNEFKPLINHIQTPTQVQETGRVNAMIYNNADIEEANETGFNHMINRMITYPDIIKTYYAMFILIMASNLEGRTLNILKKYGWGQDIQSRTKSGHMIFSRDHFKKYLKKKFSYKLEKNTHYLLFKEFFNLNNFIKHNSKQAYDALRAVNATLILANDFEDGNLAVGYLNNINNEYIENILHELPNFYKELSEKCFKENLDEAEWNHDEYFLKEINELMYPNY